MTVILDPGTDADSYTDHAVRQWKATAGLWHAQDNTDAAAATLWQGRANQAYDGGAWGVGNLWSADAHNDPNVFTDQFNAGFASGAASKTTSGISTTAFAGTWTNSTTVYSGTLATLTSPRTGNAMIAGVVRVNSSVGTHGQARIKVNGGVVVTAPQTGHGTGSGTIDFPVFIQMNLTAGDVVTIEVASDGGTTLSSGELYLTVGSI